MQVSITIDFEHDCPPFLHTYRGVEQGAPLLLELLRDRGVNATFFSTGDVARRFPDTIRRIVDAGHELGCHGDTHRRFSHMTPDEAQREIDDASRTLRAFCPVTSFRAPNLDFPRSYLPLLRNAGYTLDSSQGRHKLGSYFIEPHVTDSVRRVPATISPLVPRLPRPVRDAFYARFRSPVVFFFHPWEFVDCTREPIPLDCRYRTGRPMLEVLAETIDWFAARGAQLMRMGDLPA